MGYFPVRYDSRVVIYDRRGFIRLATGSNPCGVLGSYNVLSEIGHEQIKAEII